MIKALFNKLFGKTSQNELSIEFDSKTKKYLIDWIQVYMNVHRGTVYQNIADEVLFKDFSRIAKKNWENVLKSAFSDKVMNDNEILIEQQITSDIFHYYHKKLFHEIRNVSYNIINNISNIPTLVKFANDIDKAYVYLVTKHPKRFKVLHDIEKYGERIIMRELKIVVDKIVEKKIEMWYHKMFALYVTILHLVV